ncbi:MAG: ATP-dependent helicase [Candidatus Nanopelagicales bacterium]
MFDLLERLDPEQRAVATSDATRLRVLAGAGTGKTTALTGRAAHLIVSERIPAERVLLLTFTRRAARQMVARTTTLIQRSAHAGTHRARTGRIRGGTFHSVAHMMLRQHAESIGLSPGFGVLDPADSTDLFDVIRDAQVKEAAIRRRIPRKGTLLSIYSRAIAGGQPVSDVVGTVAPWAAQSTADIVDICRSYNERKRSLGVLDFDDLLLYWREALSNDRLGAQIGREYDHVLVDEYQDVNALQVEALGLLCQSSAALTAVGDDAQAIYSFRASSPDHILNFEQDFPGAHTLALTLNYRSTQPILNLANAIASEATVGFSTTLRAHRLDEGNASRVSLVRCADEDGQSDSVCERILELREQGTALSQQAVLVRAAHHSDRLEIELTRRGIPFVKYGGLKYLEAAHVKDLLAAFRIVDNPSDELSWFRLLQLLPRVGPAKARRGIEALHLSGPGSDPCASLAQISQRLPLLMRELGPPSAREVEALFGGLARKHAEPVATHAERLFRVVAPLIAANYDNSEPRITDLEALVHATASARRLSEVAAEHALDPPAATGDLAGAPSVDEDFLVISTVHSAKGLEWDSVHVIHAADGNFPSDMALTNDSGLEEERRLFYVALTRARNTIDVYVPLRFHVNRNASDDRHIWAQPSRFLTGAAAAHLDETTHLRPTDFGSPHTAATAQPVIDAADAVAANLNQLWR